MIENCTDFFAFNFGLVLCFYTHQTRVSLALVFHSIQLPKGNSAITTNIEDDDQPQSSTNQYPPFMVFQEKNSTLNEPHNLAPFADDNTYPEEIPLCPGLRTMDETLKRDLESLNNKMPDTLGCLFVAKFTENEQQMCDKEPQPWLVTQTDEIGNNFICGARDLQQLIAVGYYNCGSEKYFKEYNENLSIAGQGEKEPEFLSETYQMYEICYDFKNKQTLWTKHKILTPDLLTHKDYAHKYLDTVSLREFNTKTFNLILDYDTFIKMKQPYEPIETDKKKDPLYPNMKIYHLVPKDHMALPYWKKSTDHMINAGPILPQFIPLMKAIHKGILLASNYAYRKFKNNLTIYTKTETIFSYKHAALSALKLKMMMTSLMPKLSTDVFRPTMWYITVLNEDDQSGILIVLHNTKDALPAKKECDDKILPCDIRSWSEDPDSIASDDLKHAYCCPIKQEEFQELFSINTTNISLNIQKNLNLQELISSEKDELPVTIIVE